MAATISDYVAYTFDGSLSSFKAMMTAIGIPETDIVSEDASNAVYKITNGTGTYADAYLKIGTFASPYSGNSWQWQVGTGWDATNSVLTGAGTYSALYPYLTSASSYVTNYSYYKTFVTDDGSVRGFMFFNSNYTFTFSALIFRPTNTSLTANDCLLTFFACTNSISGNYQYNLLYHKPSNTEAYGPSGSIVELVSTANIYQLTLLKDGAYPVVPNAPVISHGYPIGYNSNLALSSPNLNGLDRVIVTAGSEEYVALDNFGLCLREV